MIRFKKIFCLCIITLIFLSFFSASVYAADDESIIPSKTDDRISEIVVFGDSISAGYRLDNYDPYDNSKPEDCFANILCRHYGLEYGKNFFNFSKTGDDSNDTLAALRSADKELIKKADVIIISTGGNDVMDIVELALYDAFKEESENLSKLGIEINLLTLDSIEKTLFNVFSDPRSKDSIDRIIEKCNDKAVQNTFNDAVLRYESNVKEMISYIHEINSDVQIYFLTPYDPTSLLSSNAIIDSIHKMLSDINSKTISLSKSNEYGYCTYVEDLFTKFGDNLLSWTNLITADIHPNKEGHQQISEMLIADISNAISQKEISNNEQNERTPPYSDTIIYIILGVACACVAAIVIHSIITYRKKF